MSLIRIYFSSLLTLDVILFSFLNWSLTVLSTGSPRFVLSLYPPVPRGTPVLTIVSRSEVVTEVRTRFLLGYRERRRNEGRHVRRMFCRVTYAILYYLYTLLHSCSFTQVLSLLVFLSFILFLFPLFFFIIVEFFDDPFL